MHEPRHEGVFVLVLGCRLFVTFITEDIEYKKLCTKDLEKPDIDKWADAVQRDFFVSTNIVHDLVAVHPTSTHAYHLGLLL